MIGGGDPQCPSCRQRAPIVLRGLEARCTICGALRTPFSSAAVNVAGKPAQLGGLAAKLVGCAVAVVGGSVALGVGLLLHAFLGAVVALALAIPITILTLAVSLSLLLGGRWLSRLGVKKERATKLRAVEALFSHQRGDVTAVDAARVLHVPLVEADALLTELAKDPDRDVSLDLDDDGVVHYLTGSGRDAPLRWRILEQRARLDPSLAVAEAEAEREAQAAGEAAADRRTVGGGDGAIH